MSNSQRRNTLYKNIQSIENKYFIQHMKNNYEDLCNDVLKSCNDFNNEVFKKEIISIDSKLDQMDVGVPIENKNNEKFKRNKNKQTKNGFININDNMKKKDINDIKKEFYRGNMENEIENFLENNSFTFDKTNS